MKLPSDLVLCVIQVMTYQTDGATIGCARFNPIDLVHDMHSKCVQTPLCQHSGPYPLAVGFRSWFGPILVQRRSDLLEDPILTVTFPLKAQNVGVHQIWSTSCILHHGSVSCL